MIGTIVDELMTPGCPQCAIKHMSAAVAYMAGPYSAGTSVPMSCVWAAVARINLVEVMAGYRSHLWYAVGMLVRSEEAARCEGSECVAVREARFMLEERGLDGVGDALRTLHVGQILNARVLAEAHLYEAARELPSLLVYPLIPSPEYLLDEIERVRREYFITDQEVAVDTSEEVAGKGGEEAMATKKAVKAKVDPKAAKAAAKGGKAKQACGKGGCAKKGKK